VGAPGSMSPAPTGVQCTGAAGQGAIPQWLRSPSAYLSSIRRPFTRTSDTVPGQVPGQVADEVPAGQVRVQVPDHAYIQVPSAMPSIAVPGVSGVPPCSASAAEPAAMPQGNEGEEEQGPTNADRVEDVVVMAHAKKSMVRREQNLLRSVALGDSTVSSSTAIQEKIDKRGHDTDFTHLITEHVEEHSLPEVQQVLPPPKGQPTSKPQPMLKSEPSPDQEPTARSMAVVEEGMCKWLTNLDGGQGALLQYLDPIKTEFDADFAQIRAAKLARPIAPGALGHIDPLFFEVLGVKSVGHKMLFARGIINLS